jgi:hypothetical protein
MPPGGQKRLGWLGAKGLPVFRRSSFTISNPMRKFLIGNYRYKKIM